MDSIFRNANLISARTQNNLNDDLDGNMQRRPPAAPSPSTGGPARPPAGPGRLSAMAQAVTAAAASASLRLASASDLA